MKFSESLKSNRDFRRLYAKGKSAVSPSLVLYCRDNGRPRNRLGITVGAKVGKAVYRNKVRRRLREIYRTNEEKFKRGRDLVVVARVRSVRTGYWELEKSFLSLAGKLGLLK